MRAQTALLDPQILRRASMDAVRKLDPRRMARNPVMFVVELGSVLVTVIAVADPSVFAWLIAAWLWFTVLFANLAEAIAEGRGKAQAEALRQTRAETLAHRRLARWDVRGRSLERPRGRRRGRRRGRGADSGRRRGDRGNRERRRIGDHRRVGAGDPRVRRRPLRRHRRHARPLRPDCRPGDTAAGGELPRPDDRARRGLLAAEDTERDRAQHPPLRPDDRLPARGRDAAAVRDLLRRAPGHDRARRAAWSV